MWSINSRLQTRSRQGNRFDIQLFVGCCNYSNFKVLPLDDHKLLAGAGGLADTTAFVEFIQKNLKLYELNNDMKLGVPGTANFIRNEVCI